MKKFTGINVEDYDLTRVQDAVAEVLSAVTSSSIIDGQVVSDVRLFAGADNLVETRLGRRWSGWSVIRKNANADVWEGAQGNANKFINLQCDADCTVSLWVI